MDRIEVIRRRAVEWRGKGWVPMSGDEIASLLMEIDRLKTELSTIREVVRPIIEVADQCFSQSIIITHEAAWVVPIHIKFDDLRALKAAIEKGE